MIAFLTNICQYPKNDNLNEVEEMKKVKVKVEVEEKKEKRVRLRFIREIRKVPRVFLNLNLNLTWLFIPMDGFR
jgi:hypothetical protein